ncbi:MAG: HEAT repeat domain-containing protein [Opitutaceae bacterium]
MKTTACLLMLLCGAATLGYPQRTYTEDELLHRLQQGDATDRAIAITYLTLTCPSQAFDPILAATGDEDKIVRERAVRALGKFADPRAGPTLIAALSDPDRSVRREAATALIMVRDPRATSALCRILRTDDDADVRRMAVRALGCLPSAEAAEALEDALQDPFSWVRSEAATSLVSIGRESSVEPLIKALQDGDDQVRAQAAAALGAIADPRALVPLLDVLRMHPYQPDPQVIIALGRIGDPLALPVLIDILQDKRIFESIRAEAAAVLGRIGDPDAVEALVQAVCSSTDMIRGHAVTALAALGPTAEERLIAEALASEEAEDTRELCHVVRALGTLKAEGALPIILAIHSRRGPSHDIGKACTLALADIGNAGLPDLIRLADLDEDSAIEAIAGVRDPQAVPGLIDVLHHEDRRIRSSAADALGAIKDSRAVPALLEKLINEPCNVSVRAARALVAIGPAAVEPSLALLPAAKESPQVFLYYVLACIPDPAAEQVIATVMDGRDEQEVAADHTALIKQGAYRLRWPLIISLFRAGDRQMANAFLSSNVSALETAGMAWGLLHGYDLYPVLR